MQRQPIRLLLLALAVAMAPLVLQLPWWAVGWCTVSWGYLLFQERRGWPVVSRSIRLSIFVFGMTAVLMFAGLRFDGSDFIALLAVMAGIKPLEIRSRRDSMVTVFLAYFLTITSLFVFENLSMTLYLFMSVWTITGVLIHVNDPTGAIGRQLKLSARMILVAVPLMVLLFLLFPRLSGSFWGSPWAKQSRSGFSSSLRIGDVSRLVLVDEPAFSVTFDSPLPDADQRYWRGIVFQRFDGTGWYPANRQAIRRESISGTDLSRYSVILEPHGQRHLFILDLPVTVNSVATIMDDHTLMARRPIWQRFHYSAASFLNSLPNSADAPGDAYLQLPSNLNPQAVALGRRWAQTHAEPDMVAAEALAFFDEKEFLYTLQPDRLGVHAVDDFLFVSRKGFCEHFATAFTVLMRAAGVPTRIVGGYQGGRWNALGDFLTVRHSDAHVWCEVWQAGRGWVRVDPTFAVAPDRIDAGIERALAGEALLWFLGRSRGDWLSGLSETVSQTWEAVNTRWNIWFMGFSAEDQIALFKRIGISAGRQSGWLLLMALPPLFIVGVILLGRMRKKEYPKPFEDSVLKIYKRFLDKMASAGMPKALHQGPLDYGRMLMSRHPALERDVDAIIGHYIGLRYGRQRDLDALKAFRLRVRRFNPRQAMAVGGRRNEDGGRMSEA
ncbi:transglutaminaseTgpA domain-containing protein [Desulfosarcina sp.]|uniref:transglutaminase family protein n=1 Tax=Desulfosarcina sp. TaxID=2027861 RepID=UPI00356AC995